MSDQEILAEAVRRIREEYNPRRIVLFGSRARGEAREDSDFDLMVVVDQTNDARQLAGDIRGTLAGLQASFDILVESQADWDKWRKVGPALQHVIDREGRVVLDAAA